ncbi:MAG: DUF2961 domain-containing protein [Armatimonadetes bacterium]|nr:DUF2961 domain-containing protein [Armatimonadota bacterium]
MVYLAAAASLRLFTSLPITFSGLLAEMTDPASLARWPEPTYQCLQASSYNRESVKRDAPGWFADSDGTGFIRTEVIGGRQEWVMMEHSGPGCITKIWTPFFYYDFNNRVGPNVNVYLDGSTTPVIHEPLISLVCGKGSIGAPWAAYSARAGNLYLPIPFAKSAKVTMSLRPFYFIINYRAYPAGTAVESFRTEDTARRKTDLVRAARALMTNPPLVPKPAGYRIEGGETASTKPPAGPNAIKCLTLRIADIYRRPELLRNLVLEITFDGRETVWCPVGDFFCSADSLHAYRTAKRRVDSDGLLVSRWVMPYKASCEVRLRNLSRTSAEVELGLGTQPWKWDSRSMHFYARWRPDDVVPGTPFQDWNFVDISGKGVYVGDAWTVLNIRKDSWWGEGDEKIYVDDAYKKGFPTHFGTGTEDYYGWAGGVYPVKEDEFSAPFLSNVKVGGLDGHTQGVNICTRERGLDAIPFLRRLRFDMESSFGTDMRQKWDLLGYSSVVFFYAFPGATHNRPAESKEAAKGYLEFDDVKARSEAIKGGIGRSGRP